MPSISVCRTHKKLPKQASCKQKQCTQLLDKAQRVGQAGRSMKCSYKKPPEVQHLIWHTVIFPLVSQWLQKRHLGTSLNPSEGGNLLYSRLQGIWRAIKQPDIFLVNHKLRGNFFFQSAINNLKVRLLWRVLSDKNPQAFSPFPLSFAVNLIATHALSAPLPSSPPLYAQISPRCLGFLGLPRPFATITPRHLPPSRLFAPLSPLQINVTLWSVATQFLPQCGSRFKIGRRCAADETFGS